MKIFSSEEMQEMQEQRELALQIAQLENIFKSYAEPAAIQRLANLKIAHKELYLRVLATCAQLITSGRIEKISDAFLKDLLIKFNSFKRETKIIRK